MIDVKRAKRYCREDISLIENYDKAISDNTQTWQCHHRLELTLDGKFAHSGEDLKRLGMYYDRPYFELIFLTEDEHKSLHGTNRSDETKKKLSEAMKGEKNHNYGKPGTMKGKTLSDETKLKMSESHKGMTHSAESKKKISEAAKRRTVSDEHRRKMSEAQKASWARRKAQRINTE